MKKLITTLFILTIITSNAQSNELKVGDNVAEFSALDENGKEWNSTSVKTNFLVVYFYPAAMTGGCTTQACAYRDDKSTFDQMGVSVVGVSGDEVENLKYFTDAYNLNFPLLSDTKGLISKTFGVPTSSGGTINREIDGLNLTLTREITTPRWTFVLDKNNTIIYKNAEVNAAEDSKKVKEVIENYTVN
jgi:peroxiredoxin Q/BCP